MEWNGIKYVTLLPTDEIKYILKSMKKCGVKSKIVLDQKLITQTIIRKIYKIKFNSDDRLLLNKTIELLNMKVVVKNFFHEDNKY